MDSCFGTVTEARADTVAPDRIVTWNTVPSLIRSSSSGTAHNVGLHSVAFSQCSEHRSSLVGSERTRPVRNNHGPTIFRKDIRKDSTG